VKGAHVLVDAFKRLQKGLPVELHILAVAAATEGEKYREQVRRSAAGDQLIHFLPEARDHRGLDVLPKMDALLVPSQWLETGPLVVLEAFAAGKPVIGSDLGGIRELVTHDGNGLLVPHDDVTAWTAAIARLATDAGLAERLRQGIGPVRTMSNVASDMAALNHEVMETGRDAA